MPKTQEDEYIKHSNQFSPIDEASITFIENAFTKSLQNIKSINSKLLKKSSISLGLEINGLSLKVYFDEKSKKLITSSEPLIEFEDVLIEISDWNIAHPENVLFLKVSCDIEHSEDMNALIKKIFARDKIFNHEDLVEFKDKNGRYPSLISINTSKKQIVVIAENFPTRSMTLDDFQSLHMINSSNSIDISEDISLSTKLKDTLKSGYNLATKSAKMTSFEKSLLRLAKPEIKAFLGNTVGLKQMKMDDPCIYIPVIIASGIGLSNIVLDNQYTKFFASTAISVVMPNFKGEDSIADPVIGKIVTKSSLKSTTIGFNGYSRKSKKSTDMNIVDKASLMTESFGEASKAIIKDVALRVTLLPIISHALEQNVKSFQPFSKAGMIALNIIAAPLIQSISSALPIVIETSLDAVKNKDAQKFYKNSGKIFENLSDGLAKGIELSSFGLLDLSETINKKPQKTMSDGNGDHSDNAKVKKRTSFTKTEEKRAGAYKRNIGSGINY